MNDPLLIQSATLLSTSKIYQIERILYRFSHQEGSVQHPQYIFRPLAGQKKKADLKLNYQKLLTRCYEVPGMSAKAEVTSMKVVQMTLF